MEQPADAADEFEALYQRHRPALVRYACAVAGDASIAEDIVHDVFQSAWRHRADVLGAEHPEWWLRAAVYRRAVDRVRRRQTERRHRWRWEPGVRLDDLPAGFDARLLDAFALLSPPQRHAVYLRDGEGCSFRAIGRIMGTTEANARVVHHRARARLATLVATPVDAPADAPADAASEIVPRVRA